MTGWFSRDWSGEEQQIADTLPKLALLSAGKGHEGFALKKLLRLEGHPHPQGQDKESWCLGRHWGHSGLPDAGPVSNGTGSEQRSRLPREALASTLLEY